MSTINQIQKAIRELSGGAYQKLMDVYLYKRFGFTNITQLGSHTGSDKTTKGTPDSFVQTDDGKYILIAYGAVSEEAYSKIEKDILACLDESKTGISKPDIQQIICCHTSTNISVGQHMKLCSHFPNTLLIGLGDLSMDLLFKYPNIAKDHLSIAIDTHQVFDVETFIKYDSQNVYSTSLDMPLLCREKEIEELTSILNSNQIVIVCGASGIGKTRLAIESVTQYAKTNNSVVRIVRSNGENIYDDLYATFTDDQDFIILVDDANQLTQIKHVLDLYLSSSRQHSIKLILTVREYAKEDVLQKIKDVVVPVVYSLKPLEDKCIESVITENLGIRNAIVIRQIVLIAKGNIRLAIMAGMCALKDDFESIRNAFDIFDNYYSDIITSFDEREILVAALIALFDSLKLEADEMPIKLADDFGISFHEFKDICGRIHAKEIISIYRDLAIKFENQNVRDYLLYYVFFKSKRITPSYIIKHIFPEFRTRIVYAFNTLIMLFNTTDNQQYIENEIKHAWSIMRGVYSKEERFQFIETFHSVMPVESLLVIKQEIDCLPEFHIDFLKYDFEKTRNNHTLRSRLIPILASYKYHDCYETALEIMLYHLERNTGYPMDFYFLFSEELGFHRDSYLHKYSQERLLVEKLHEYFESKKSPESAMCLSFCISHCLKHRFSSSESTDNRTVTFYQFGLHSCPEVFEIRGMCFAMLARMFVDDRFKKIAIKVLLDFTGNIESESDETILENDIQSFTGCFISLLKPEKFEDCVILHHFFVIGERYDISRIDILESYIQNSVFLLYEAIVFDRFHRFEQWEKRDHERELRIEDLCNSIDIDCFDSLWCQLEDLVFVPHSIWEIETGINSIFKVLANKPERFFHVLDSYLIHNTPYDSHAYGIVMNLIDLCGYDGAISFIGDHNFYNKQKWLTIIHDNVPEQSINSATVDYFVQSLYGQKGAETIYALSFLTVLRIDSIQSGFAIQYLEIMNDICKDKPWVLSGFLAHVEVRGELQIDRVFKTFESELDVLEMAYLTAIKGRQYFDYHGTLLLEIIRRDRMFITVYIKFILSADRYDNSPGLGILWEQDDYEALIEQVMNEIRRNERHYSLRNIANQLFERKNLKSNEMERQNEWIKKYIENNYIDLSSMKFIFSIICNLSEEQRKNAIITFIRCNKEISIFKNIPLFSYIASFSGSEVPYLQRKIDFLEHLKTAMTGIDFLEHHVYLNEEIQYLRSRIEAVLIQEFIEE